VLELKRPLNGLKNKIYVFQDISANADYTFKVTDLPDKFLLGKNSFKLHLNGNVLVHRSEVFIDILDKFGNPIYYTIIRDNLPNKERIVVVYIYDTTPIGECELIIAGRLETNPKTGLKIPYSNDPSSQDFHGIPNVVWRKVLQINPKEVESPVYFSIPPTVTYSEIRKPQYRLNTDNRLVNIYSTSSSTATMYSNRGQLNTVKEIESRGGATSGHILSNGTSSATFVPITPIGDGNEIASVYFTNFDITASMEGGRLYFNNIPYSYPANAVLTESKVLNYSGSIVKIVNKSTCFVTPTFYHILNYTDNTGTARKLVLDGFREVSNFTASYHIEPKLTISTASYDSYIKLQIENSEPAIGSIKAINVKAKSINKPGQYIDLGTYDVGRKNILTVGTGSYTMTSKGIEPLGLGDFRKLGNPLTYWTGSSTTGSAISFSNNDALLNGVLFPDSSSFRTSLEYSEFYLLHDYLIPVKKGTEYELSFDMAYLGNTPTTIRRQLDVYISGSEIDNVTSNQTATYSPIKNARFGTYIGSVDDSKTLKSSPTFYFVPNKDGKITPRFVNRTTGAVYSNITLSVRNKPGYSANYIDLEVPLPKEFDARSELGIFIEYLNSKNEKANIGTSLYGVVFDGNTASSSAAVSTTIPSGTVSGSDQLTSSFDWRYERKGTGIISSSAQIRSDISGSFTDVSSSISKRIYSLEQTTGSLNIFTGSANSRLNSLETNTGSYATTGSNTFIGNQKITGSLDVSGSISFVFATGSFSGIFQGMPSSSAQIKVLLPTGVSSGSEQFTSSYDIRYERKGTGLVSSSAQIGSDISGSFTYVSSSLSKRVYSIEQTTGSLNTFTGSINTRVIGIENITGSYLYTSSIIPLNNHTGSTNIRLSAIELTTGSLNTYTSSNDTRLNNIEIKTGSYATTGSNQFNGNQSVSGSVTISSFLVVARATGSFSGSFSGQYSSSKQVNYDQITNKPVIKTPGIYRILTSDGTVSGSVANEPLKYISSSTDNRVRMGSGVNIERGYSSSYWTTRVDFITQSVHSVNNANFNFNVYIPVLLGSDDNTPITPTIYNATHLVEVENMIYGITGSLASPIDTYNWASTCQFRILYNPKDILGTYISGISLVSSSANNSSSLGGYGTVFGNKKDLSNWYKISIVSDALSSGNIKINMNLRPTSSFFWTAYVATSAKIIKHEIRI
jgi:hypothetical protein